MSFYEKYIKYKTKYLELNKKLNKNQSGGTQICSMCTGDHCLKTKDCLIAMINQIPDNSIHIEQVIPGDSSKETNLIVIPGFSESSYKRNSASLFKFYSEKLNPQNFKNIIMIKFKDDEQFSIRQFNMSFFNKDGSIIDPLLENKLYEKCAQIIVKLLDPNLKYTILAKSAGGGVGICLSQLMHQQIHKMFLFAPGAEYLNKSIDKLNLEENRITVGWNTDDNKVKMSQVWPELSKLFPNTKVLTYNKDIYNGEDTQHEINSQFIQWIKE